MNITYYVQRYRPQYEAISKEIELLATHFSTQSHTTTHIHDLHLDGHTNFKKTHSQTSFHFAYYPLLFPTTILKSKKSDINHIYTSLGDLPYLPLLSTLNPNTTILTAAASCNEKKIKSRLPYLKKIKQIIVETKHHQQLLLDLNIPQEKIKLIYPPVNLNTFTYHPLLKQQPFTILYASCPTRYTDFKKRGIYLLIETAKQLPNINFLLLWRHGAYQDIITILKKENIQNITITNEIITDMNSYYAKVHCTITPYTIQDDFLKLIPNSAIESLAAGKPILASTKTEIAQIITTEQSGVSFEPNPSSLIEAITKLQKKYDAYRKKCVPTAKKYFNQETFLEEYTKIYNSIQQKKIRQN
jgi:glycosyltransferase involved in cell wall biosynthesis